MGGITEEPTTKIINSDSDSDCNNDDDAGCTKRSDEIFKKTLAHSLHRRKVALAKQHNGKNTVRFSTVRIREYMLCLGDNPSVTRGAPISLDWVYIRDNCYELEDYEQGKHSLDRNSDSVALATSTSIPAKLLPLERIHILKERGYSRSEIKDAMDRAHKIREQRLWTKRHCERVDRFQTFVRAMSCFSLSQDERIKCVDVETCSSTALSSSDLSLVHETDKSLREHKARWKRQPRNSLDLMTSQRKKLQRNHLYKPRNLLKMLRSWHEKPQETDSIDTARHMSVRLEIDGSTLVILGGE